MSNNRLAKKVRYTLRFLPDELYIQLNYFARFKKSANFKKPVTYNRKLDWLKLHDHDPSYTVFMDKYGARKYVEKIIRSGGGGGTIPTLGIWERFEDMNFGILPSQFVLKYTHDPEGLVIVKDRGLLDKKTTRVKTGNCLEQNLYCIGREWPYKSTRPKAIAEKYMEDARTGELRDYKFFCSDGEPRVVFIISGRNSGHIKFDCYDMEFNRLGITQKYPNAKVPNKEPSCFNEMVILAGKLSFGIPHIRVDLYEVNRDIYPVSRTHL